jgi:hypothetical protein
MISVARESGIPVREYLPLAIPDSRSLGDEELQLFKLEPHSNIFFTRDVAMTNYSNVNVNAFAA